MKQSIIFDDALLGIIQRLKEKLCTQNTSYIVRVAVINFENFLNKNSLNAISRLNIDYSSLAPAIEGLAGMDLDVVESHFVRFRKFRPTVEVYRAAVEAVKEEAASKGEPVRNPEAALYGKMKQWTLGKWKPTVSVGAVVPPPPGLKSQKEIEKELYGV